MDVILDQIIDQVHILSDFKASQKEFIQDSVGKKNGYKMSIGIISFWFVSKEADDVTIIY